MNGLGRIYGQNQVKIGLWEKGLRTHSFDEETVRKINKGEI